MPRFTLSSIIFRIALSETSMLQPSQELLSMGRNRFPSGNRWLRVQRWRFRLAGPIPAGLNVEMERGDAMDPPSSSTGGCDWFTSTDASSSLRSLISKENRVLPVHSNAAIMQGPAVSEGAAPNPSINAGSGPAIWRFPSRLSNTRLPMLSFSRKGSPAVW